MILNLQPWSAGKTLLTSIMPNVSAFVASSARQRRHIQWRLLQPCNTCIRKFDAVLAIAILPWWWSHDEAQRLGKAEGYGEFGKRVDAYVDGKNGFRSVKRSGTCLVQSARMFPRQPKVSVSLSRRL